MPIRVLIAEDSLLVREGLARVLGSLRDVQLVGAVGDLEALLAAVADEAPDVVLADIRMPPSGTDEGIRAARLLRQTHPDVGVVVLSQHADTSCAVALLEQGSQRRGYLLKERVAQPEQLLEALRAVAAGGSFIDPQIVDRIVAARTGDRSSSLGRLTQREREVLAEMASGANNAAIAAKLVVSERAVEKHINSIFSKLGLAQDQAVHRRVKAVLAFLALRQDHDPGP